MYRILLAEDEVTLREVVEVFFRKNGFEIDAVDNGIDACSLADKQKYDVVILDIMMPGMDGKEVCRHIRSGYDVPIIFLTALGDECDIISGYEIGADEYVTKPFSTKVLAGSITVTPSSMSFPTIRAFITCWATASCRRELIPITMSKSPVLMPATVRPRFRHSARMSVR